jgi:hypothetical protein
VDEAEGLRVKPATVKQCKTCPWRVDCDPLTDIPNGYSVKLHEKLRNTIATGMCSINNPHTMACHYSKGPGEEFPCAGWIHNQLGVGNNIGVRLRVMNGSLPVPEIDGEQHEHFDDTLPVQKPKRAKAPAKKRQRA